MGLRIGRKYGTPVVFHYGNMPGYKSVMLWLPEHDVGAVLIANADSAWPLVTRFSRKLLEVLFDGRPEADEDVAAAAKDARDAAAAERALLTVPADPVEVGRLAARYANPALGELSVRVRGGATTFDFGAWESAVVTRKYQDGTVTFYTSSPGARGTEFAVGSTGGKRTLVLRDAQNEYVYTEQ